MTSTFAQVQAQFLHDLDLDRTRLFVDILRSEMSRYHEPRLVDIGCGHGLDGRADLLQEVSSVATELWGVEPDPAVRPRPGLFHEYRSATLEGAGLPASYFDIAYSYMVMEHVERPAAFLSEVRRILKPGGVFLYITPNGRHYFVKTARTLRRLRLDDWVLRRLRGGEVDSYHYPVVYGCSEEDTAARLAREAGFSRSDFAYYQGRDLEPYFPGPLRHALGLLTRFQTRDRNPKSLVGMIGRFENAD